MAIHRGTYSPFHWLICLVGLLAPGSLLHAQIAQWNNTNTGPTAGVWSSAGNWLPTIVPGTSSTVHISNGGEVVVDVSVDVNRIEVGKNGGNGTLTSTAAFIDILMSSDFDTGEVGGFVATGPFTFTSNGTTTITDAASILVGTSGVGDLDVGQAGATSGATAFGTGVVTIERVPLVQITSDMDIGQTEGTTATATAQGTFNASNVTTLDIGAFLNVGEAGDSSGTRNATGSVDLSFVNSLLVKDEFNLGRTYSGGGPGVGNGTATITDAGTVDVGKHLQVGLAIAKGGGTAQATGTLTIERADSLQVGTRFSVGQISSELKLPDGTVISGQADSLASSASITDVANVSVGTGLFVGRAFTADNAKGTATGTLTIDTATSVTVGGDLDVGQTGSTGTATEIGVSTGGTGNATIRNVTGTVSVGGDIDVGTTGSVANTSTQGNGILLIEDVGTLDVIFDLDVGQVSGAGQSTGIGMATIRRITNVVIGEDIDVGKTSGSPNGINSGQGTLFVSDATVSVGFADPIFPGSLAVGNATALLIDRAQAVGNATFERTSLSVASRISVGGLSGGGTDATTTSSGTLNLVDSLVLTPQLDVALVLDNTAGTVDGTVRLDSTLLDVAGAMTLGPMSTLEFGLSGTIRADGTGVAGQYSAINAISALLDGTLDVQFGAGFAPSLNDTFELISAGTITGDFDTMQLPSLAAGLAWQITVGPTTFVLTAVEGGLVGDYNGNGIVDAADYTVWRDTLGSVTQLAADGSGNGIIDADDYDIWKSNFGANAAVGSLVAAATPEPASTVLVSIALALLLAHRPMHRLREVRHT